MDSILMVLATKESDAELREATKELVEKIQFEPLPFLIPLEDKLLLSMGPLTAAAYIAGVAVGIRLMERRQVSNALESLLGDIDVSLGSGQGV